MPEYICGSPKELGSSLKDGRRWRRAGAGRGSRTSSKKISATPFVKSVTLTVARPPMTTESMLHSTAMASFYGAVPVNRVCASTKQSGFPKESCR